MALVALPSTMYLPNWNTSNLGAGGLRAGLLLDVENDLAGMVIQIGDRDDGKTIDKFGLRIHTVGTTGDVDARLEGVSLTDGLNDGTLKETNSNKVQSVSATGWNEFALTDSHVVAKTDILAVLFVLGATASASITTGRSRRGLQLGAAQFPYGIKLIDPAAKQSFKLGPNEEQPSFAVGFSDGTWMHNVGISPILTVGTDSIISSGTKEVGMEFQVPNKGTLASIVAEFDYDGDFSIHIGNGSYNPGDTGATRLSTITHDKDVRFGTVREAALFQVSPVDLEANTTYRAVFEATTTTACVLTHQTFDAAALVDSMGYSTAFKHILDNGAGGWTTTATKLSLMSFGFSKFDDGATLFQRSSNSLIGR